MIAVMTQKTETEPTPDPAQEHYRHLRTQLREARKRAGLRQEDVALRITEMLRLEKPLTDAAVSAWETFTRHPAINVMDAWARVVGLRLVVDLDAVTSSRIPVLLRPETADIARTIDLLDEPQRKALEVVLSSMHTRRR
jgi:transcriptional regulator with XRE-family HTH domain